MATVVYKLVLEGLVPEVNDQRVRGFLTRIFGEAGVASNLSENFPREVPGEFDFQRASEWMEALARAGVRSRVEITGAPTPAALDADATIAEPWLPAPAKHPIKLWLELLSRPDSAYAWLAEAGSWPGILLGLLLICLGNVLAYPGELWLLTSAFKLDVDASPPLQLWATLVLLEPVFRLLFEGLLVALTARLLGAKMTIAQAAAIAGPAHAADPLKAIPFIGPVFSWLTFLWLTAVGLTAQGHLDQKRGLAYVLLPFASLLLVFASMALLLAGALGSLDVAALASHLTEGLEF